MKGVISVNVSNGKTKYSFELNRNITIVRGNSGTGKTTLYDMIAEYTRLGSNSGVQLSCDKECIALVDIDWKNQLRKTNDSIVFIDEGAEYLSSKDFAKAIKGTTNYYVIFNRENLHELPYSVEEIYEIKTSGKYHRFEKAYKRGDDYSYSLLKRKNQTKLKVLLLEDSKSGFQFFESFFKNSDVICETSESNTNIFGYLKKNYESEITVVADGAAFGAEMDRIMKLQKQHPDKIKVFLPESFEWMILKSGIVKSSDLVKVLEQTSDYVESSDYFSWEQFFTDYLVSITNGQPNQYKKSNLNKYYMITNNAEKIIGVIGLNSKI